MAATHLFPNQQEAGRRWKFGDCEFIEIRRELLVSGEPVKLESKPLEVLQHLLEHPAQVVTKDELIGAAWATSTTDQSLTTAIAKLRKAFGGPRDSIILSVSGVGYRMAVPVACEVVDGPPPPQLHLHPGDAVPGRPNWKLVKPLASNGPHSVWLAEHSKTREARVFKFATDGVRLRALQREVTLSRLFRKALGDDAGFVRILDWDFEREPFFIESEYCGHNLFEWSETEEFANVPASQRIAIVAQIAQTVAAAHALGILHNDLKPANVLIAVGPEDVTERAGAEPASPKLWEIKVADFGVASVTDVQRLIDLQITHYGSFENAASADSDSTPVGTAMYRAPEMLAGAAPSIQGDVYALGVMLYQIVCGDFLEAPSVGWESRISDPVLRQDIADAANIDPARRIASASELAARLRTLEARRAELQVRAAEIAAAEQAHRAMENARLRRPWLIFAMVALVVGLSASVWFYRNAVRQRDLANAQNRTLSAMNDFLTVDLLGQGNPLAGPGQPKQPQQETLIEAINTASPQIDSRFANSPGTAGQLHESIAAALDARTDYEAADREFEIAAQRFREAEGPLSENALISEFRRENTQIRSRSPAMFEQAKLGFDRQEAILGKLHGVTAETQAWAALAETAIAVSQGHAREATHSLDAAVQRAESTPNFNPSLLMNMRLRYCALYMGEGDWVGVERISRQIIDSVALSRGQESPALFQPKMFLQEALFEQGRFPEALAQGKENYPRFIQALGPQHQLTIAALQMIMETEGAMGDVKDAIRDGLALHATQQFNPAGEPTAANSLVTAASLQCRTGSFREGIENAREVVRENSTPTYNQPIFVNLGNFAMAECFIDQEESSGTKPDPDLLNRTDQILSGIDVSLISRAPGLGGFEGSYNVAEARLALLRGDRERATKYADRATAFENWPDADPFEKKAFSKVEAALTRRS